MELFKQEQDRFTRFIQTENERLNRLIRNLYLHFHLEHYRDRDLYDHICQELADYFHADTCALYLISYEEPVANGNPEQPRLKKWIELTGACGPWRRALREHYVRRRSRSRFAIPIKSVNSDPTKIPELTRRAFFGNEPCRYISAYDFRRLSIRDTSHPRPSPLDQEELSRQVIWYNDGLYNSSRCALLSPIVREGNSARRSPKAPLFLRIGVIKVENRSPSSLPGFSDSSNRESTQSSLLFSAMWEITALRPYVRDLQRSVRSNRDPFLPLHNNVGWQQYFDDHPQGAKYYHQLLLELRRRRKLGGQDSKSMQALASSYAELAQWLESLLEVLIRLEAWLQHLRFACRVACRLTDPPSLDAPVPSLFDIHNLAAAYSEQRQPEGSATQAATRSTGGAFPAVRRAVLECVSPRRTRGSPYRPAMEALSSIIALAAGLSTQAHHTAILLGGEDRTQDSNEMVRLEEKLIAFMTFLGSRVELLDRVQPTNDASQKWVGIRDRCRHFASMRENPKDTHEKTLDNLRTFLAEIRSLAERQAEDMIQALCETRAKEMLTCLKAEQEVFDIVKTLDCPPPVWDFKGALSIVLSDLTFISTFLAKRELREADHHYELLSEEIELKNIQKAVASVLADDTASEKQYAVACSHYSGDHGDDELGALGCRTARAVSAATMFADSFNEIDEKRLTFIASHIAQVIDNHLLQQARQRHIELDYTAIDTLGLERFTLSLLDMWAAQLRQMSQVLNYVHGRNAFRYGLETLDISTNMLSVKHLIESIARFQTDRRRPRRFACSCLRMTCSQPGIQSSILGSIVDVLQSMPGFTVHQTKSKSARCYDACSSLKDAPFVELQVRSVRPGTEIAGDELDFFLSIPRGLLMMRDVRAVWHITRIVSAVAQACERIAIEPS